MGGCEKPINLGSSLASLSGVSFNQVMRTNDIPPAGLNLQKTPFGTLPTGESVDKFTLTNAHQMEVSILTYGGIVHSIAVPDRYGNSRDVALGFDTLEGYLKHSPYFGATIGRYGNRIAKGQFTLDGKKYQIPTNDGPNALHGGPNGFDKQLWKAVPVEDSNAAGVDLTYFSADGEMGFPGNLATTVRYALTNDNELQIHYSAVTDKNTIISLTNHTYFNLAGAGEGTVLDQLAMINADRFAPVDNTLIPTGELDNVKGTPLDFTEPRSIGAQIRAENEQLKNAEPKQGGYDHNWVLNNPSDLRALAVRITDPHSGRTIEAYTTEPAIQFYSGNFLSGTLKGKDGLTYAHWGGFTLEAQHYPDSPNHPHFPSTELKAGEKYAQTTIYRFSAK